MKTKIIFFLIAFGFSFVNAETLKVEQASIFKNIRCLICQGQSVYDSDSEFANSIKILVKNRYIF